MKWDENSLETAVEFWKKNSAEDPPRRMWQLYQYKVDERGTYEKLVLISDDYKDVENKRASLVLNGVPHLCLKEYSRPSNWIAPQEFYLFCDK